MKKFSFFAVLVALFATSAIAQTPATTSVNEPVAKVENKNVATPTNEPVAKVENKNVATPTNEPVAKENEKAKKAKKAKKDNKANTSANEPVAKENEKVNEKAGTPVVAKPTNVAPTTPTTAVAPGNGRQ